MKETITITKTDVLKGKISHSKWLKHKESRFNTLFPKRLEKVYSTIRSLSKLSNRNNYFYDPSNIFMALSSIVLELRELAASYGLDSSDIKIDIYSLSDQQKKPTLKTDDIRNNDAKDIASELLEIIEKKIKTEEKLHSEINTLKRELSFLRDKVENQQWSSTRNFT
jgi:hypothetical protein